MPFTLKVVTLNLRNNSDRWPERQPLVVQGMLDELPHLAGLQEACLINNQAETILRLLNEACRARGLDACYELRLQPKLGEEGRKEGIAILSRLPIENYGWLDLAGGDRVAQRLRVRLPGGQPIDFYNTHLHHEQGADALRAAQAQLLLDWIARESHGVYSILVGDMNAVPTSPAVSLFKRSLGSCYALVHGQEPACTFPTPLRGQEGFWGQTIDYIFVAPGGQGRVLSARRAFDRPADHDPTLYPSDHYGLAAEIEME